MTAAFSVTFTHLGSGAKQDGGALDAVAGASDVQDFSGLRFVKGRQQIIVVGEQLLHEVALVSPHGVHEHLAQLVHLQMRYGNGLASVT